MKDRRFGYVALFILLIALFSFGYAYLLKVRPPSIPVVQQEKSVSETIQVTDEEAFISIKIYFPDRPDLIMEQKQIQRVFSQKKILKEAIKEFLKGPAGTESPVIPVDAVLLSVYIGSDGVAYINFSEDFRRNFHGDAMDEYLLLKGLYESTISNIKVDDVRILIQGKEVDAIGGHFVADRPLKRLVTQEIKFDQ